MLQVCLLVALLLGGDDVKTVEAKMRDLIAHGDKLAKAGQLDAALACYESAVKVYEKFRDGKKKAVPVVRKSKWDPPADLAHLKSTPAAVRKKIDALVKVMFDVNEGRGSLIAKDALSAMGKPAFPRILGAMAKIRDTITDVDSGEERMVESSLKLADEALREIDGWLTGKGKSTLRPGSERRYIQYICRLHYKRWMQKLKGMREMPGPFDPAKTYDGEDPEEYTSGKKSLAQEKVVLPAASKGVADKKQEGRIAIELTKNGEVRWKGKAVTLKKLAAGLKEAKRAFDQEMKKTGRSGYEKIGPGVKASSLFALLRVDRDAPWVHVQWLLYTLAAQRIYKTQFAVADGRRLDCWLPTDRGTFRPLAKPVNDVLVSILIQGRKEVEREFGPADRRIKVIVPTAVVYTFDGQSAKLADMSKWIAPAKAAAAAKNTIVIGEIKAGQKTPFKYVVAVLDRFHADGLRRTQFYGTRIPGPGLREMVALPYPKQNWTPPPRPPR